MDQLDILLVYCFNRYDSDIRPWDRIENSFRVIKIIFVAFDKSFNMPSIEQLDVMAQISQLFRLVMGTATGLYADQAVWIIGKKDQHLLAF